MTKGQIEKIYEKYCYNKHEGELDRWEETLNKIDDETIKKVFTTYGDEISCLSSWKTYIIEALPERVRAGRLRDNSMRRFIHSIGNNGNHSDNA